MFKKVVVVANNYMSKFVYFPNRDYLQVFNNDKGMLIVNDVAKPKYPLKKNEHLWQINDGKETIAVFKNWDCWYTSEETDNSQEEES